jgi:hypothetical protein
MAPRKQKASKVSAQSVEVKLAPKCVAIAEGGLSEARDVVGLMGALVSDLVTGRVGPSVGNATVNAVGKLLKVVELQHRYGRPGRGGQKHLALTAA